MLAVTELRRYSTLVHTSFRSFRPLRRRPYPSRLEASLFPSPPLIYIANLLDWCEKLTRHTRLVRAR